MWREIKCLGFAKDVSKVPVLLNQDPSISQWALQQRIYRGGRDRQQSTWETRLSVLQFYEGVMLLDPRASEDNIIPDGQEHQKMNALLMCHSNQ